MAAPSGTTWGSTVGSYGRIGIYTSLSSTSTQTTLTVEIWFWSKYSVSDSSNTLYYDNLSSSGSASTSRGACSISTSSDSGGWSTTNQKKLKTYTVTYTRGTSAQTRYLYSKLSNVDRVGGTMYASKTVSIPKLASYTVSYNANGGSGAPSSQTKYYGKALTLSSTKPTRTGYTFQGWGTSTTDTTVNYAAGGSYTTNASDTLYAIWKINTWSVTYNANGGTGAPSKQTKTYNKTLTLSATKPTRTGYDFKGWGTSASDTSVNYAAGANYTGNAALTLYAIWEIKTYTVTYNANGGSGAPGKQTKTHDATIKLSSTTPTRTGYTFQGWGTSASSTAVAYKAGGSYTANANITLYAVWINSYKKPTISNIQISRCDKNGNPVGDNVEKTSGLISFVWTTFNEVTSIDITWISASGEVSGSKKINGVSGTSNTVSQIFGDELLPLDQSFAVTITVSDSGGSATKTITLEGYLFTIDMLGGGKGVSFGKPAELENTADFEFKTLHRESSTYMNNIPIIGKRPDGTEHEVFKACNSDGNTTIGRGNYDAKNGGTNLYGYTIQFGISDTASAGGYTWAPYRRRGHISSNITVRTAGYVTNSGRDVTFWVPVSVPIVGSPTVTVSSNSGFVLRQNDKYTHGSASSTYVYPNDYEVSYYAMHGIRVTAKFLESQVINVTNNDSIGVYWNGTITFS